LYKDLWYTLRRENVKGGFNGAFPPDYHSLQFLECDSFPTPFLCFSIALESVREYNRLGRAFLRGIQNTQLLVSLEDMVELIFEYRLVYWFHLVGPDF
jgi:hypothetical protein